MLYLHCRRDISTRPPISLLRHLSLYYATYLSTVLSHLSLYLGPYLFSAANLATQTHISLLRHISLYSDTYLTQTNISQLSKLRLYQYSTTVSHYSPISILFTQLSSSLLSYPTLFLAVHLSTHPLISLLSHPSAF